MRGPFTACLASVAIALAVAAPTSCPAQRTEPLRVGVYDVAPYGSVAPDGSVGGLSVDLWRRVAERLGRRFELTPVSDMAALLQSVRQGRFDVAVGAITVTAERERLVDFSYPAHRSGVAVALRRRNGPLFALRAYFEALAELGPLVVLIFASLAATGLAMWRIERSHRTAAHESHVATLRDGLYWAAVTMTTVGYGDKTPKTNAGRMIATAWMFGSLVLISLLSTSLVSKLMADHMDGGTDASTIDLSAHRLAAVADSSGAEYLNEQHFGFAKAKDLPEALDALRAGTATGVVNSVGALRYAVARGYGRDIEVAQGLLAPAYMAFALPSGSDLRLPINEALIKITGSLEWTRAEERFFKR